MAWDYYASGADDETCLRRTSEAWSQITLHYRVLVDVARRELRTTTLHWSTPTAMPIVVAPTAFHKLAHPEGEDRHSDARRPATPA